MTHDIAERIADRPSPLLFSDDPADLVTVEDLLPRAHDGAAGTRHRGMLVPELPDTAAKRQAAGKSERTLHGDVIPEMTLISSGNVPLSARFCVCFTPTRRPFGHMT
jgi:hypothetical protein